MARHHGTRWHKNKVWRGRKRQKHHRPKNEFKKPRARRASAFARPQKPAPPAHLSQGETQHHCVPQSRGGPDTWPNIRWKPNKIHVAWHILFANMTPREVIQLIRESTTLEEILRHNGVGRHYENRKWAWDMVFTQYKAVSKRDCIKIVRRDWTPNPSVSDRVATVKGPPILPRMLVLIAPDKEILVVPDETASGQKEG